MTNTKEVFGIRTYERNGEKKTEWTQIGRALVNRDGSLSVILDYIPNGQDIRINIRDRKEKT